MSGPAARVPENVILTALVRRHWSCSLKGVRVLAILMILAVACSAPAPTVSVATATPTVASTTSSPSFTSRAIPTLTPADTLSAPIPSPNAQFVWFVLPAGCSLVGAPIVGSDYSRWQFDCGTAANRDARGTLAPALTQQAWTSCGVGLGNATWMKAEMRLIVSEGSGVPGPSGLPTPDPTCTPGRHRVWVEANQRKRPHGGCCGAGLLAVEHRADVTMLSRAAFVVRIGNEMPLRALILLGLLAASCTAAVGPPATASPTQSLTPTTAPNASASPAAAVAAPLFRGLGLLAFSTSTLGLQVLDAANGRGGLQPIDTPATSQWSYDGSWLAYVRGGGGPCVGAVARSRGRHRKAAGAWPS